MYITVCNNNNDLTYFPDYTNPGKMSSSLIFIDHTKFSLYVNLHSYREIFYVRSVTVPDGIDVKQHELYISEYPIIHLTAEEYILGEPHSLADPETLHKFDLKFNMTYYNLTAANGWIDLLDSSNKYSEVAMNLASMNGHINVLTWFLNNISKPLYNEAVELASSYGQVAVLEWWKNSGLILYYSDQAMDMASCNGHVEVLEWWKNSGLPLKYTAMSLEMAYPRSFSFEKHLNVCKWWVKSGLKLKHYPHTGFNLNNFKKHYMIE
uniref:Ankyrin repeat protein n=1 Tax=viral metagenome TaxID=1070528 RepID=A0A6C0E8D7_9ZZZZ